MRPVAATLAVAWALGASSAPAHADQPLWELGVGIGHLSLPYYRGAATSQRWWLPTPYFVYRGDILRSDREGTRAVLFENDAVDFDISFAATAPADSEDDTARSGMPDLAPTVEFGPQLNMRLARGAGWHVDLRMPLRSVILLQSKPRSIGWSASPVLNLDVAIPRGNIGVQAGVLWGSRRLNGYFYDVAPVYATAERPAYATGSGYAGWQTTAAVSRRIGNFWLGAFARRDSLAGAVFEASPLVKRRDFWTYGLAVSWIFAQSERRVEER